MTFLLIYLHYITSEVKCLNLKYLIQVSSLSLSIFSAEIQSPARIKCEVMLHNVSTIVETVMVSPSEAEWPETWSQVETIDAKDSA